MQWDLLTPEIQNDHVSRHPQLTTSSCTFVELHSSISTNMHVFFVVFFYLGHATSVSQVQGDERDS